MEGGNRLYKLPSDFHTIAVTLNQTYKHIPTTLQKVIHLFIYYFRFYLRTCVCVHACVVECELSVKPGLGFLRAGITVIFKASGLLGARI